MSDHRHECSACDGKGYFCRSHGTDTDSEIWCEHRGYDEECDIVACDFCSGEGSPFWDFEATDEGFCHRCRKDDVEVMAFSDVSFCEVCFAQIHAQRFPGCKKDGTL